MMNTPLSSALRRKEHTEVFLQRIIRNRQFEDATECIQRCHKTFGIKPKSMLLVGDSGAGKSTIIDSYIKKYPGSELIDRTTKPILKISLHSRVTINDMLSLLLEACGDPEFDKGTARSLLKRIYVLIRELGVQIIVIDEIHHVLPEHTHRRTQEAADMIKSMTDRSGIPFVLVGLPHAERLLTDSIKGKYDEDQLIRRFNSTFHVKPALLGSTAWKNLMRAYQEASGVPCIDLTSDEMLKRMHLATNGYHGLIANIMEHALEITDGTEQIIKNHFAKAYEMIASGRPSTGNPFTMSNSQVDQCLGVKLDA